MVDEKNQGKAVDRRNIDQPVKNDRRVSAKVDYEALQKKNREFAGWLLEKHFDDQSQCSIGGF